MSYAVGGAAVPVGEGFDHISVWAAAIGLLLLVYPLYRAVRVIGWRDLRGVEDVHLMFVASAVSILLVIPASLNGRAHIILPLIVWLVSATIGRMYSIEAHRCRAGGTRMPFHRFLGYVLPLALSGAGLVAVWMGEFAAVLGSEQPVLRDVELASIVLLTLAPVGFALVYQVVSYLAARRSGLPATCA